MKYLLLVLLFSVKSFAASSEELLRASDLARGAVEKGVSWKAEIVSVDDGDQSERKFTVKVKDVNALVDVEAPARNRGEKFLFNDRVMWFMGPNIRKPVSINARQRMSGQAANGDIANTRYSRDYTAKLERTEKVGKDDCTVLFLTAKSKDVTYDKIRYWISNTRKVGVKAEFLTLQGEIFKKATFEYNNKLGSLPFISKMTIQDAKFPENKSVITYLTPTSAALDSSVFNMESLAR